MINLWIKYVLTFVLFVLVQGLVLNPMQLDELINPMIYPMLILMLPFELGLIATMAISLLVGFSVDAFSNTFGLHASASLLIGYLRPTLLRYIKPRDGYDSALSPSIHDMGISWFLVYAASFLGIHHLWFFTFEVFRFDLFLLILGKTFATLLVSLLITILFQYILYAPSKK